MFTAEDKQLTDRAVADFERARNEFISLLGITPNDPEPIALFHLANRRYADKYSLLWFLGSRTVCQNFFPNQGPEGAYWSRQTYDYDADTAEIGILFESEKPSPQFMRFRNLYTGNDTGLSHASIFLAHITNTMDDLIYEPEHTEVLTDFRPVA